MTHKETTICANCKHFDLSQLEVLTHPLRQNCLHPDVQVTDFVTGRKDPHQMNFIGNCKYFEAKE